MKRHRGQKRPPNRFICPLSMMSAPPSMSVSACRRASSRSKQRPPSAKESGVQLTMPMTSGCDRGHNRSIRERPLEASASRCGARVDACWVNSIPTPRSSIPNSEFLILFHTDSVTSCSARPFCLLISSTSTSEYSPRMS